MMACWFSLLLFAAPDMLPMPKAELDKDGDIDGIYRSVSKEAGKDSLTSVVVKKVGAIHVFQWGSGAIGVGVRQGDSISVGWTVEPEPGKVMRGVTVYRIKGRRLEGSWASLPGNRTVNVETLTWLGGLEE